MAFGLGVLRLTPKDFWSMTPRELHRAAEGVYGRETRAPSRATLDELIRNFPDARSTP